MNNKELLEALKEEFIAEFDDSCCGNPITPDLKAAIQACRSLDQLFRLINTYEEKGEAERMMELYGTTKLDYPYEEILDRVLMVLGINADEEVSN